MDKVIVTYYGKIRNYQHLCIGISEKKVEMVPNGCDLELFKKPKVGRKPRARRGKFKCIYAGTLGAANGLEAVIEAAALLQSNGDDRFEFLLVGI